MHPRLYHSNQVVYKGFWDSAVPSAVAMINGLHELRQLPAVWVCTHRGEIKGHAQPEQASNRLWSRNKLNLRRKLHVSELVCTQSELSSLAGQKGKDVRNITPNSSLLNQIKFSSWIFRRFGSVAYQIWNSFYKIATPCKRNLKGMLNFKFVRDSHK